MDGASKFVKGDAMAAVVITAINLIGGIVVGMLQHHIAFGAATKHYSLLTVGDGLAAQIPALLISVATGIIVTRSGSERDLGSEIATQILGREGPAGGRGTILAFALVPGLPKIPFLLIGGLHVLGRLGPAQERGRHRGSHHSSRPAGAAAASSPPPRRTRRPHRATR